tara:strand:+ start:757 stop:1398 length:642 start_codon:yes stop_codon:yes gene_type:complete
MQHPDSTISAKDAAFLRTVPTEVIEKEIARRRGMTFLPETITEQPKKKKPNPFKSTYSLRLRVRENGGPSLRRMAVDPATCIDTGSPWPPEAKREKCDIPYWAVWVVEATDYPFEFNEDLTTGKPNGLYVGNAPFLMDAGMTEYTDIAEDETYESLAVLLMNGFEFADADEPDIRNDVLVIDERVWWQLAPNTQESLLRDSVAKEVYICEYDL